MQANTKRHNDENPFFSSLLISHSIFYLEDAHSTESASTTRQLPVTARSKPSSSDTLSNDGTRAKSTAEERIIAFELFIQ